MEWGEKKVKNASFFHLAGRPAEWKEKVQAKKKVARAFHPEKWGMNERME